MAWDVCRNQVFGCFFQDFCNLLEPSVRAGGSGTMWTLWSSVSFGVSKSKTTPNASHLHRPSIFFVPCFSGLYSSLNTAVVRRRRPRGRGTMPGEVWPLPPHGHRTRSRRGTGWAAAPRFASSHCHRLAGVLAAAGPGVRASSPRGPEQEQAALWLLPRPGTLSRAGFPEAFCSGSPL